MNTEKKETLSIENTNPQAQELADLFVTDEQAKQAIGGSGDRPTESISINFTKIDYTYTPYDDQHKS